jgi:carbonic anhydrase/acetyltransferase-like protein (isoleucine patch superfamily)
MTVRSMGDKVPVIAATAWVSEAAYVVGDVHLGEHSSVWPGAVVRGDFGSIRIGEHTVVEDNCVVHSGGATVIGNDDIVGHSVVLHCAKVGSNCLIGSSSTLLDDAEIGDLCLVAAGTLVPPRLVVPERSFVSGSPATIEPLSDRRLERLRGFSTVGRELGYSMMAKRYRDAGL